MDGTVRCRYSGAPLCPLGSPSKERTSLAPAALNAAQARPAGPRAHYPERPP